MWSRLKREWWWIARLADAAEQGLEGEARGSGAASLCLHELEFGVSLVVIEFVSWISELRLPLLIGYSCCAIVLACISSIDSDNNQQRVPSWFAIVSLAVLAALRFPPSSSMFR